MFDEMENKIFPTIIKRPINNVTSNKFLNVDTKIPLIKLTTSDFPDFWCYRSYIGRFDKTIQKQLRETTWNSDLEDCFIDFGDENDNRAINKKEEIVNFPPDTKPFYFSLYKLELILIGDVSDKVTEKLYVADPKKLNYLIKSFLREIPLDYPFEYHYDIDWKDDRREDILKKGDRNNNIYSFLEFHLGYFEGYKEDFIHNLLEITNDIWKVRTKDNQFRRELLNEWIEEKIEEYNLDRTKLGLEKKDGFKIPVNQDLETLNNKSRYDKLQPIIPFGESKHGNNHLEKGNKKDFEPLYTIKNRYSGTLDECKKLAIDFNSITNEQQVFFERYGGKIDQYEGHAITTLFFNGRNRKVFLLEINSQYFMFIASELDTLTDWVEVRMEFVLCEYLISVLVSERLDTLIEDDLKFKEYLLYYKSLFGGLENDFLDFLIYPNLLDGSNHGIYKFHNFTHYSPDLFNATSNQKKLSILEKKLLEIKNELNNVTSYLGVNHKTPHNPKLKVFDKELNFIDKLNLWFEGLSYLGELIFPCSIPSDILYIEEELNINKELIDKYLKFISEYGVFTELQSFIISCDDKIKIDGLLRFVGNEVDGLERRYLKRFDESFGTDEYKNKFYGELKGSHNLYKLMNDYEYKVDMGIRMCNQVIFLYSPPSQSDPNPEPKPTIAPELIKLNYGVNNDKIIQLLHVELNGIFIENVDFKDFERHFKDNGAELKKMQWKGTQPEIIRLFTGLLPKHSTNVDGSDLYGLKLDSDYEGYHQIVEHFYYLSRSKRDRTDFIYENLTSKRSSETKRENTIRIHTILENIRNVVS